MIESADKRPPARGLLIVMSSPSGAGKTTLCRRLMEERREVRFSVSVTTRPPRAGEVDGVDYVFVDKERFARMVDAGDFAEWAEVHGNRYGTPRAEIERALEGGRDVLFDVDWQGGKRLREQFPDDVVMIWILPPSLAVLEERLRRRATDAPEVIARRLEAAKHELAQYAHYDYLVVNEELERAYLEVRSIYVAAHRQLRRARADAERLLAQLDAR